MQPLFPHIAPVYREEVGNLAVNRVVTGFESVFNKCLWAASGKGCKWVSSGQMIGKRVIRKD